MGVRLGVTMLVPLQGVGLQRNKVGASLSTQVLACMRHYGVRDYMETTGWVGVGNHVVSMQTLGLCLLGRLLVCGLGKPGLSPLQHHANLILTRERNVI